MRYVKLTVFYSFLEDAGQTHTSSHVINRLLKQNSKMQHYKVLNVSKKKKNHISRNNRGTDTCQSPESFTAQPCHEPHHRHPAPGSTGERNLGSVTTVSFFCQLLQTETASDISQYFCVYFNMPRAQFALSAPQLHGICAPKLPPPLGSGEGPPLSYCSRTMRWIQRC